MYAQQCPASARQTLKRRTRAAETKAAWAVQYCGYGRLRFVKADLVGVEERLLFDEQ